MPEHLYDILTRFFKRQISYIKHETERDCLYYFPLIIKGKEQKKSFFHLLIICFYFLTFIIYLLS